MCHNKKVRNYYRYYDTPEGHDLPKKAMCCARYGAVAGLILSTYDVLMYSHAVGLVPILKRYALHTAPLALMGATFAVVSNTALKLREKNDPLNYFIGGVSCGPILAAYLGSGHAVVAGGIVLGLIGVVKKESIDHNVTLYPEVPGHMNMINSWRHDYTLRKDPRDEMVHTCITPPKQKKKVE